LAGQTAEAPIELLDQFRHCRRIGRHFVGRPVRRIVGTDIGSVTDGQYAYVWVKWQRICAACSDRHRCVAGAAVARSWGDKVVLWSEHVYTVAYSPGGWCRMQPHPQRAYWNPRWEVVRELPAAFMLVSADRPPYRGVHESKQVTNIITALKWCGLVHGDGGFFSCLHRDKYTVTPVWSAGARRHVVVWHLGMTKSVPWRVKPASRRDYARAVIDNWSLSRCNILPPHCP
jgi:hypothetical protein